MRITQRMITRNYLSNTNKNLGNMSSSYERISSGRKFTRISENLSDGARALRIRRQLSDAYQQQTTVRDTQGLIDTAWNTLNNINSALETIEERMKRGADGTQATVRDVFATEIGETKKSILQMLNSKYADKNIFGGSNNNSLPYTIDETTGNMLYNGVDVSDLSLVNGKLVNAAGDEVEIPYNEDLFVDLGNGMRLVNGKVDSRTAFKISFDGLDIMGYGTETVTKKDGTTFEVSNNIINLISDVERMFANPAEYDDEKMQACLSKIEETRQNMMLSVTDLDTRAQYLDTISDKVTQDIASLTGIRSEIEGVNDSEEIMKYKMYEYTWLATLKMGAKLLPQSLMDYLS